MSLPTNEKYYFSVETLEVLSGRRLKALRPDSDGYFQIPLAVIGEVTRNQTYYEPETVIEAITSPKSRFHMTLTEGNLYGEYGHPPRDASLERIADVLEERQSHHIRRVATGERLESGGIPLIGWVKPCGPFGKYLEDNLMSTHTNTSFSLRSIVKGWMDQKMNCLRRAVQHLVTFDYVGMGGFQQASKRFSPATESYNWERELTPDMFYKPDGTAIAYESISDKSLLELFGMKEVFLTKEIRGLHFSGQQTFLDDDGNRRSVTHALLSRKVRGW